MIGINIEKGIRLEVEGIGKVKVGAYIHKIAIHIGRYKFKTEVDFSYNQEVPLLGRKGFFDHFKSIDFRERKRLIYFTPY